jgi:hypothetical protein
MKRLSWTGGFSVFGSPGIVVTEAGGSSGSPFRPQAETTLRIAIDISIVVKKERLVISLIPNGVYSV